MLMSEVVMDNAVNSTADKESVWQERLLQSWKNLLIGAVAIFGGWICIFIFNYVPYGTASNIFGLLIYVVPGLPVLISLVRTRSVKSMLAAGYTYTETTYSDGSKSDDKAMMGMANMFIKAIILFFLATVLAPVIALIKFVWFAIKSITSYFKVKEKPTFLYSPFAILAGLVAGIVVTSLLHILILSKIF
jgi:hypothetical protein